MPELLNRYAVSLWGTFSEMSPYLLFGFLVAGILSEAMDEKTVRKHLGGKGFRQILKASTIGIPIPLCSCGVIPVAASLKKQGASGGATTAFLISTPQTGLDSIMVTLGLLGPVFAFFKAAAAFVSGIAGGGMMDFFRLEPPVRPQETKKDVLSLGPVRFVPPTKTPGKSRLRKIVEYGFSTLPKDIGKSLVIGLLAAAAISAAVPEIPKNLSGGFTGMVLTMLMGIPLYVCATASVPIAAALMAKGFSSGAALVFLMTGPATNAATITTVWSIMGRRAVYIYLASIGLTALISGYILDYLLPSGGAGHGVTAGFELPHAVNAASAAILLAVLGNALISTLFKDIMWFRKLFLRKGKME